MVLHSICSEISFAGNTNWNHPRFFAYYPAACSYPAILSDILSNGINATGFDWRSSPSLTELEMKTLDWLVDVLGLPEYFKNSHPGRGCGISQTTASESTLLAIMCARARMVDVGPLQLLLLTNFMMTFYFTQLIKNNPSSLPACGGLQKTVNQLLEDVRQETVDEEDPSVFSPHYHDPTVFRRFIAYFTDQARIFAFIEPWRDSFAVNSFRNSTLLKPTYPISSGSH
ncbi:Pyridoxal-dependent decarboxylase domain protein [Trichostrongylus colubriformis]|uniref:Aromatic-L-amino-acid decarboxylase n=1 Tax=Trichostrongylus colubriformis TaxID=6319 RepID=A0AAN8IJZ4_TRICO